MEEGEGKGNERAEGDREGGRAKRNEDKGPGVRARRLLSMRDPPGLPAHKEKGEEGTEREDERGR